jgi:hypothetical protein
MSKIPALLNAIGVTPGQGSAKLPALIATAGERASHRYVEFFTTQIRNPNTRRANPRRTYAKTCETGSGNDRAERADTGSQKWLVAPFEPIFADVKSSFADG